MCEQAPRTVSLEIVKHRRQEPDSRTPSSQFRSFRVEGAFLCTVMRTVPSIWQLACPRREHWPGARADGAAEYGNLRDVYLGLDLEIHSRPGETSRDEDSGQDGDAEPRYDAVIGSPFPRIRDPPLRKVHVTCFRNPLGACAPGFIYCS